MAREREERRMRMNRHDYTNSSIENLELFFLMSEAYKLGMVSKTEYMMYVKECLDALMGRMTNNCE